MAKATELLLEHMAVRAAAAARGAKRKTVKFCDVERAGLGSKLPLVIDCTFQSTCYQAASSTIQSSKGTAFRCFALLRACMAAVGHLCACGQCACQARGMWPCLYTKS